MFAHLRGDGEAALPARERELFPRREANAVEAADGLRDVLLCAAAIVRA